MDTTLIPDIFTYFAKYPLLEGVKKNFKNKKSTMPGYLELKNTIDNLPVHSLLPELEDYVFGMNEKEVFDRIRNMKGMFLFIDYGQINMNINERNDYAASQIHLAINVGHEYSTQNDDIIEESIIMNKTLVVMQKIIKQIMGDDKASDCPFKKYFNNPTQISPIEPKSFHGKLGWNVMFTKNEDLF